MANPIYTEICSGNTPRSVSKVQIAVTLPDLSATEGSEPVEDAREDHRLPSLPNSAGTGTDLRLWSRRVVGYVAAETGKLVTKTTHYELRMPPPASFSAI